MTGFIGRREFISLAFARMMREKTDALFVGPGTFFNTPRVQLAVLTARHGSRSLHLDCRSNGIYVVPRELYLSTTESF